MLKVFQIREITWKQKKKKKKISPSIHCWRPRAFRPIESVIFCQGSRSTWWTSVGIYFAPPGWRLQTIKLQIFIRRLFVSPPLTPSAVGVRLDEACIEWGSVIIAGLRKILDSETRRPRRGFGKKHFPLKIHLVGEEASRTSGSHSPRSINRSVTARHWQVAAKVWDKSCQWRSTSRWLV